jgi:outer membrane lipoprotein-sorting protein
MPSRNRLLAGSLVLAMAAWCGAATASSSEPSNAAKKFGIKSGAITMKMAMSSEGAGQAAAVAMGSTGTITRLFDDYGARESIFNETAMEMMGMKINAKSQTIITDGMVYIIDPDKKTGTKSKILKIDDPTKIDWANASPDYVKRWNIKKEGSEVVAGKTCDIYSLKTDDIHAASGETGTKTKIPMAGKCWVWNNIGLKADFVLNGSISMKLEATKVDENATVPPSTFEVPADVKIKEGK